MPQHLCCHMHMLNIMFYIVIGWKYQTPNHDDEHLHTPVKCWISFTNNQSTYMQSLLYIFYALSLSGYI